ncbi:MAG: autotransporter outer membrane beta-barrel domain-containing protein, partial [Pseudomonadota bacterium]
GWVHTNSVKVDGITVRKSQNKIRPVGAVGLEYHVTRNVGINAQYMRVFGGDKIASYDAVTGGLTYYFS